MSLVRSATRRFFAIQLVMAVLLFSLPSASLVAQSFNERRTHVGLKLFRTLLAADLQSAQKVAADGKLPIHLVYASDAGDARELRANLKEGLIAVHDIPVRIEVTALADLLAARKDRPAAIFVAQQFETVELERLIRFCIDRQIILFSPFEGDVEKGVLGGLSVEATVRPMINMRTLNASRVAIKSFYLKVAKQYASGND